RSELDVPGRSSPLWKESPLLLTLSCFITLHGGQMVQQRAEIWGQYLRLLLDSRNLNRWKETGQADNNPPCNPEVAIGLLRALSWELHRRRRLALSIPEFFVLMREWITPGGLQAPPAQVLQWLYEAGVVEVDDQSRCVLLSAGLQEYLTASHIASQ